MDSQGNSADQESAQCTVSRESPDSARQNAPKRKHEDDEEDERRAKAGCQRDSPDAAGEEPKPDATDSDLAEILKQGVPMEKPINLAEILPSSSSLESAQDVAGENAEAAKLTHDFDISEKLREMGEISVQPVSKSDAKKPAETESKDEVSVEITKKGGDESEDKRKVTNLRKNIREVMDDNQLDASTLAAQREELERLARVQEQQKIIRAVQRQIDAEKQNSKMQSKVLSLLQGHTSLLKSSAGQTSVAGTSGGAVLMKVPSVEPKPRVTNLTPSVSIAPVRGPQMRRDVLDEEEEEREMKINAQIEAEEAAEKEALQNARKEVVTIVDSSSEDDCIVLSDDDEEEEETDEDPHNSGLHVKDQYNVPDDQGRVIINIGHPENEPDVFVAPQISRVIKPHQIGGVRFLYDNIIESLDRFETSTGFGCILAHSMGLGKTLQLVCFCDIFLRHTSSKTVLCIMPVNTLQNWIAEFNMWLPENAEKTPLAAHGEVRARNFKIHVLNDSHKSLSARSKVVLGWVRDGGVLMIGYEMFRLLSMKKMTKKRSKKAENDAKLYQEQSEAHKHLLDEMYEALVKPGPDLVVCDEGHRIKNSHASISVALKQIKSRRRIVLTGYPLQNNLMEYWCMVDFVRPNYLGTKTEFANMFERPIQNGQCIDSTPNDIKLMRYRAHVLHSLLLGFVQRRSHMVLQCSLPQKEEYVLLVRMTEFQRKLYDVFMNDVVRTKSVPNPLKAFAVCCKIWNHPDVLYNFLKKREADLDLEIEVAEAANGEANVGKKGASPKKPRGKKLSNTTKTIDMDGKMKPAATILPTTNSTVNSVSSQEKPTTVTAATPQVQTVADTSQAPKIESGLPETKVEKNSPNYKPPEQNYMVDPNKQMLNYPNYNHYPNTYDNYGQYPQQDVKPYQNMYGNQQNLQSGYYQNQTYADNYNYNPNANMQYDQGNYWQSSNYYQNNSQPYNQSYGNYDNQYRDNRAYMMEQQSPAQQPTPLSYGNHYPYNAPQDNANEASGEIKAEKTPSDDQSSAIVDMDTKEIKLEAKSALPEVDEVTSGEKEDEGAKEVKEDVVEECEKESVKSSRDDVIPYDWAVELMKGYVADLLENAPKMQIFFCILEESLKLGDRILVFSQSLLTLNLIEKFLQMTTLTGTDIKWARNTNYYRLDGSTSALDREKLINEFNSNPNIQLFLVSTRAGSLGINLVGANRVIVFDASWNPCHDTQAVCRVYRYGQKKPCFVYRLVMDNCLEKKIYDRQVNKQGMSDRVVDECNPDAHLSIKEVTSLCWDDEKDSEEKDFGYCKDKFIDLVMQKIIDGYSKILSKEPFQHESLLVDRKEKKLSQAEKRLAQRGYELEKQASARPNYAYNNVGTQYRAIRTPDGSIVHRPVASVRPMQSVMNDPNYRQNMMNRQTRWIPAEVWQRQGMTAQEMTLPLDVVIPTSSAEKSNIVLKAGQKVMVLKSPKGIYMQLETGKIIAIRTAFKVNHGKDGKHDADGGNRVKTPVGAEISDSESMALVGQNAHAAGERDRVIDLDKDGGNESESMDDYQGVKAKSDEKSPELMRANNPYGVNKFMGQNLPPNQGGFADSGNATVTPANANETINQSAMNHNYQPFPPAVQPPGKIDGEIKGSNGPELDKNTDDVIMLSPEPGETTEPAKRSMAAPYEAAPYGSQAYHQYPPYQQHNQHYSAYGNQGQQQYYSSHHQMGHPPPNPYNAAMQMPPANPSATQTSLSSNLPQGTPQGASQNTMVPPTITIDDDDTEPIMRQKVVYKPNLVSRNKKPPPSTPPQSYGAGVNPQQNYTPQPVQNAAYGSMTPKSGYRMRSPVNHHGMPHTSQSPHMSPYYKQGSSYRPPSNSYDTYGSPSGDFQPSSLSCLERTTSSIDESKSMYKASLSNITNSAPLSPPGAPPSQTTSPGAVSKSGSRGPKPRNRRKANSKSPALPQSVSEAKPGSPARKVTTPKSPKGANGPSEVVGSAQNQAIGQQHLMPGQYNPSHPPYYTTPLESSTYQSQPAHQVDSRSPKSTATPGQSQYGGHFNQSAVPQVPAIETPAYSAPVSAPDTTIPANSTYAAPQQSSYAPFDASYAPPVTGSAFHRPENAPSYTTPAPNHHHDTGHLAVQNQYASGQYQSSYMTPQQTSYAYNPPPGGYYPPAPAATHSYPSTGEYDPSRYQPPLPPVPPAPHDSQYTGNSYVNPPYSYPPYAAPPGQAPQANSQWQ
ncbi:helicase ARIP4 [Phlebotomus argentipes]|uniref:helicase ARIP4 n=1 Tax=Phlebotomus argentipes TaxID=94469 RepID=UPI0028937745|nr:helicase ARIP4 [Phlebotomus argentipes]